MNELTDQQYVKITSVLNFNIKILTSKIFYKKTQIFQLWHHAFSTGTNENYYNYATLHHYLADNGLRDLQNFT